MRKSRLIQHYKEKQASFQLYFKRTFERQEIEDIHQLRLTIKKLRASWSLMDLLSRGKINKKRYFTLFSKLFDEAGEVREAQVSLSMIQKSNAIYLVPFAEYLSQTQSRSNTKLLTTMRTFDFEKFEILNTSLRQEISEVPAETALSISAAFVLKKIGKISQLKNHLPNTGKLHKIRIHLKAVIEILRIMDELSATIKLGRLQINFKTIDRQIGIWHDNIILLDSLNYFTDHIQVKKNVRHLMGLIGRIENQQEIRQGNIYGLIDKYITQEPLKKVENLLYKEHYFLTG